MEKSRQFNQEMMETIQPSTIENLVAMLQEVLKIKTGPNGKRHPTLWNNIWRKHRR